MYRKASGEFPSRRTSPLALSRLSAGSSPMIAGKEGRQFGHQRPVLFGCGGLQLCFQTGHIYLNLEVSVALSNAWMAGWQGCGRRSGCWHHAIQGPSLQRNASSSRLRSPWRPRDLTAASSPLTGVLEAGFAEDVRVGVAFRQRVRQSASLSWNQSPRQTGLNSLLTALAAPGRGLCLWNWRSWSVIRGEDIGILTSCEYHSVRGRRPSGIRNHFLTPHLPTIWKWIFAADNR